LADIHGEADAPVGGGPREDKGEDDTWGREQGASHPGDQRVSSVLLMMNVFCYLLGNSAIDSTGSN
jgi:hypothetical protein